MRANEIGWAIAPVPPGDYQELDLEDVAVLALQDAEAYRALTQEALRRQHEQHRELERLREQHGRMLDECRRLREAVLREQRVA